MQVQAAPDLTDGGLDELEILGVAEPPREPVCDHLGTGPLPQARRQQGTQAGASGKRVAEPGEVLSGQALKERPSQGELRNDAGRPVVMGCGHEFVVRIVQWRRIG